MQTSSRPTARRFLHASLATDVLEPTLSPSIGARSRFGRGWLRLEAASGTRRGAALLFAVSLAVYGLQSLAVPLFAGRDLGTYLGYYDQFVHGAVQPMLMLYRTPVAPLVVGPSLDFLGPAGTQVLLGVLFACSVVAWSAAALTFGPRAALLTAAGLLAFPTYGYLFHAVSSDVVFAAAFSGWAYLLTRATVEPSPLRFGLVGLGVALLALVRPGNQVLVVFVLLPLVVRLPWRLRLASAAAFLAAVVIPLGLWATHNGVRYGDYVVNRGSGAFVPFFRMFVADHVIDPENGPASRELARTVERRLLPLEPYRSYRVTVEDFFSKGDARMHEDLVNLSDQIWGWDDDYAKLRAAAWEAFEEHPGRYVSGVGRTIARELWTASVYTPSAPKGEDGSGEGPVNELGLPVPTEGSLIPAARMGLYSTTPDGSIREVWTSPTEHRVVFADARDERRFEEVGEQYRLLSSGLPAYEPPEGPRRAFNLLSRLYPRALLWLVLGLAGILVRRPRHLLAAIAPALAGLLVITFTALGISTVIEFATPVYPAFVVFAAAGLAGARRPRAEATA